MILPKTKSKMFFKPWKNWQLIMIKKVKRLKQNLVNITQVIFFSISRKKISSIYQFHEFFVSFLILVNEELSQKQSQLNSIQSELQSIKESATHQRKRINEMLRSLLTDLGNFQFHEKKIMSFLLQFYDFF